MSEKPQCVVCGKKCCASLFSPISWGLKGMLPFNFKKIENAFFRCGRALSLNYQLFTMSISITQLNKLAEHFGFNVDDARDYLGIPLSSKRGRPSKSMGKACVGGSCKVVTVEPRTTKSTKTDKPQSKRGKTGYQLFMAENCTKITAKLKSNLKPGEKLARGTALSAVGAQWKALGDSQKKSWNTKAANM